MVEWADYFPSGALASGSSVGWHAETVEPLVRMIGANGLFHHGPVALPHVPRCELGGGSQRPEVRKIALHKRVGKNQLHATALAGAQEGSVPLYLAVGQHWQIFCIDIECVFAPCDGSSLAARGARCGTALRQFRYAATTILW
jgi:hypothetical protein